MQTKRVGVPLFRGSLDLTQSRIKVHFVATFLNIFSIVFVTAFWNIGYIWFDNLPKKYGNGFQLKMYQSIQDLAKFR